MVYSHEHSDHIGGASVFDVPGVTIVAHELTKRALADHPLPGARIPMPTVTFTAPKTLHFGGRTIRLFRIEPWTHAQDLIGMQFVEDRTLFAADLITVKGVGFFDFSNERFPQMIEAIRRVQRLDYDHLVDSHGPLGTKADGDVFLAYVEALRASVRAEIARGASLEETQHAVSLNEYRGLELFEPWREMNVQGAYVALKSPAPKAVVMSDTPPHAAGESRVQALAVFCSACHGPRGVSTDAHFPNLAGQKYEYLLKSLRAYQRQERYDPYMSQLEFLADEDLQGIAHYYSSLSAAP
jgi:cytochrome c553